MTTSTEPVRRVVVFSSINLDTYVSVQHIPQPGETVLSKSLQTALGGKGANTAVAATRAMGVSPAAAVDTVLLVAAVADDGAATVLRAGLERVGVNDAWLVTRAGSGASSGQAFIAVAADGDNSIIVHPGANMGLALTDLRVDEPVSLLNADTILVLHLEIDYAVVAQAIRAARAANATVVLNASPVPAEGSRLLASSDSAGNTSGGGGEDSDVWGSVDILIVNAGELSTLAGAAPMPGAGEGKVIDAQAAAEAVEADTRRLRARLGMDERTTVVTTRGADGVVIVHGDGRVAQTKAVLPRGGRVVNTTGAGDCMTGFVAGLVARGQTVDEAVRVGVAAAGIVVGRDGAADAMPELKEAELLASELGT